LLLLLLLLLFLFFVLVVVADGEKASTVVDMDKRRKIVKEKSTMIGFIIVVSAFDTVSVAILLVLLQRLYCRLLSCSFDVETPTEEKPLSEGKEKQGNSGPVFLDDVVRGRLLLYRS
jgi:hypothetical protein